MKKILFLLSFAITSIVYSQTTPTLKQVANAGNVAWKPLFYNANYGAQATDRWLTDKRYVDSSDAVVSAAGWKITGNVLGADTRFLGSTDNFDVLFKTNNIERGRFLKTGELRLGLASTVNASLILNNSTNANTLTINSGVTSASYALTLPTAQGGASTVLQNNGSGVLSWASPSATAWMLNGNTVGSEKWIGTNDNFAFPIRTNSVVVATFNSTGELGIGVVATANYKLDILGVGNTLSTFTIRTRNLGGFVTFSVADAGQISAGIGTNLFHGLNSGLNITGSTVASASNGVNALAALNGLGYSTAMGYSALRLLQGGFQCSAFGNTAVESNVSANNVSGFGHAALTLCTGDNCTAAGSRAGASNTSGTDNLYAGFLAGFNRSTGSRNIHLGPNSGTNRTTQSDELFIDNRDRTSAALDLTRSLVYGVMATTPQAQVFRVNADFQVGDSANFSVLNKVINTTAGDDALINANAGRFRKDASGTTFTLTNNKITANSIIQLTMASDPGITGFDFFVVAGAGSAVITFTTSGVAAAPSNNTDMNFFIIN